mmetsp:Transcript_19579/g.48753  ORF Transcript_19579/g.48753 Transcript_19579/m.48753 type:complete len:507 (-) Transcript_19579:65-1585(-)|eukprot:CAMPEP_0116103664 /NCGR_PEP_ID=MMETSP0327-20121206/14004_1 /TAXON_ID=44447 /ORGANISM="Pseudo-nitzschia delicatissima, Strain B596" /LENGTH=506 /DNA_ID=CAMNT_0003595787 /DNA_START=38 /DNA_END=1558 /DNA_ORIENTATION=+
MAVRSNGNRDEPNRARFHPSMDEGDDEDGPLEFLADLVLGMAALWISFGLLTIVVLAYVFVRPFSIAAYRRLVDQIGTGSYLEAISLLLPNTRICLTGDSDVPSPVGTSILVSNHVTDGDWYAFLALGRCVGLRGSIKVFLRNEIFHLNKRSGGLPTNVIRKSTSIASTSNLNDMRSNSNATSQSTSPNLNAREPPSPDLALAVKFFHSFLDFPLIDEEGYVSDRESLFKLLRSFADGDVAPVHFLLFPEGWSLYNGESRNTVLARSNDFAKREGRPQLKHLLLPRSTGFNASISSLRESSPVIYDATVAYSGYKGRVPLQKGTMSLVSLWQTLRRRYPEEIHVRIKRYSMEEVLQDASWLDKKWAEKDRLLQHFSRHRCFPLDSRGFCRHQMFETRYQSMEVSAMSFLRLALIPCVLPILIFLSIPIVWTTFCAWIMYKGYQYWVLGHQSEATPGRSPSSNIYEENISSVSRGTPFIPATPFASPSVSTWHDMVLDNIPKSKPRT